MSDDQEKDDNEIDKIVFNETYLNPWISYHSPPENKTEEEKVDQNICYHEFKLYQGFTESYDYCVQCGIKR